MIIIKRVLLILGIINLAYTGSACTTFFIRHKGQMMFGRNYDWITDAGMICTNQRNLSKTSMKNNDGNTISWISKYGSISFNQYGKEFPTGGMNEKGLVVELMWLDGTQYPNPDERPALGVLQWIQYQLDNCAEISDVIATDKLVRIASKGTTPLHYLVADAKGGVATIEFLEGKMIVHEGNNLPFPVLTNDSYQSSAEVALKGPGYASNNSLERFTQTCELINELRQSSEDIPLQDYSFKILDKVAQGSFTKWSIVYDVVNKKVYYKTARFQDVRDFSFSDFDFNCNTLPRAIDMNQEGKGSVGNTFVDFSIELNRRIVETAFKESNDRIGAGQKTIEANWQYASNSKCVAGNRQ
jgi:penicillin V acylase-like amidase (Ntn superfamily)